MKNEWNKKLTLTVYDGIARHPLPYLSGTWYEGWLVRAKLRADGTESDGDAWILVPPAEEAKHFEERPFLRCVRYDDDFENNLADFSFVDDEKEIEGLKGGSDEAFTASLRQALEQVCCSPANWCNTVSKNGVVTVCKWGV